MSPHDFARRMICNVKLCAAPGGCTCPCLSCSARRKLAAEPDEIVEQIVENPVALRLTA